MKGKPVITCCYKPTGRETDPKLKKRCVNESEVSARMKKTKQLMAVFLTAVLIAGSRPVTLSAADRRENVSTVSVESSTDTAADTDQQAETQTEEISPERGESDPL